MMKTVKLLTFFLLLVACTKPSYENCSAECNKNFPNKNQRHKWRLCMTSCDQAEKAKKVELLKTLQNGFLLPKDKGLPSPKDKGLPSPKDQCISDCAYTPLNIRYIPGIKAKMKKQCAENFEAKFNKITSAIKTFDDQDIPFDVFSLEFGPDYMLAYKPIADLNNLCIYYANRKLQYKIEM